MNAESMKRDSMALHATRKNSQQNSGLKYGV